MIAYAVALAFVAGGVTWAILLPPDVQMSGEGVVVSDPIGRRIAVAGLGIAAAVLILVLSRATLSKRERG